MRWHFAVPIALVLVAATFRPPMPPMPLKVLQSPKQAATFVRKTAPNFVDPSTHGVMLSWGYTNAGWETNIWFDLWHIAPVYQTNTYWTTNLDTGQGALATNLVTWLTNWVPFAAVTGQLSCSFTATQTADFFKVRAVWVATGVPSDWNTK